MGIKAVRNRWATSCQGKLIIDGSTTDLILVYRLVLSMPRQCGLVKISIHTSLSCVLGWLYSTYSSDVMTSPMSGRSPKNGDNALT